MPKILFPIGTKVPNSHLFDDHKIDAFSKKAESDITYVNIAGGTMTGPLTVSQGKSIYLKQNIDNNYGEITYIDKNNNELLSLSYFDNDLGIKSSSNNFHKIWHTGNFNKDNYITKEDANKFLNIRDLEDNVQSITGYMFQGNNESGIISNYNEQTKKIDFTTNNPTITLAGGVTGSAKMTNLSDVIINATVVNDSHNHDLRYKSFMKISDGVNEINADKFNDELILSESDGLSLSLDVDNKKIIFAHGKTSTQQSSINNGRTYIQSVELDKFGHITDITTSDVESITWDNIIEKPDAFIPILGETLSTAYRGDRGKIAYDHSQSEHASVNAWVYDEDTIKSVKVNSAKDADTVNGKTVAVNVPANAKFTDTVYTHPSSHPASMITGLHASATTGVAGSVAWNNVTGKPSTFTPSSHSHSELAISDIRDTNPTPDELSGRRITTFFNNLYGDTWRSGITVAGWTTGYTVWQLSNPSSTTLTESLMFRAGNGASWSPWRTIWHSGNVPATATRWPTWGEVTGKPSTFTPSSHNHSASNITSGTIATARLPAASTSASGIVRLSTSTSSTSTSLAATASAVKAAYDVGNHSHPYASSSHTHSKSDVGLGSVQNYGIATQAQAEAGTSNSRYMTPLRVAQAIASLGGSGKIAYGTFSGPSNYNPITRTINVGFAPYMIVLRGEGMTQEQFVMGPSSSRTVIAPPPGSRKIVFTANSSGFTAEFEDYSHDYFGVFNYIAIG